MFGLSIGKNFTEHSIYLINEMGKVAKLIKVGSKYSENQDLQKAYVELVGGIRQQKNVTKPEDFERISNTIRTVLTELSEPELD